MVQKFYTKWQNSVLADAKTYVSKKYRQFQTALIREISNYAKAIDATMVSNTKAHYDTSCVVSKQCGADRCHSLPLIPLPGIPPYRSDLYPPLAG